MADYEKFVNPSGGEVPDWAKGKVPKGFVVGKAKMADWARTSEEMKKKSRKWQNEVGRAVDRAEKDAFDQVRKSRSKQHPVGPHDPKKLLEEGKRQKRRLKRTGHHSPRLKWLYMGSISK